MLRTDLFKTLDRAETRFIAFRDTLTLPDPDIDVTVMDKLYCKRGSFGIGHHFLVLTNGIIQLARNVHTVGSHSRDYDAVAVAVGVVGGVDENGDRLDTRTFEQNEAMQDLFEVLSEMYPLAVLHDKPAA